MTWQVQESQRNCASQPFLILKEKKLKKFVIKYFEKLITIEKFDYICKVHIIVDDDVPISLHKSQRHKQIEMRRAHVFGRPDRLPDSEHVTVDELSLEVEQKPAIREIEVSKVASEAHVLE